MFSYSRYDLQEEHFTSDINFKHSFQLLESISGYIKMGGKYKFKNRQQDKDKYWRNVTKGHQSKFTDDAKEAFDWVVHDKTGDVTMRNLDDQQIGKFLQGGFNYGWYPDIDRLNKL